MARDIYLALCCVSGWHNICSSTVPSRDRLDSGAASPGLPPCAMAANALLLAIACANFPPYFPPNLPPNFPPAPTNFPPPGYLLASLPPLPNFPHDLYGSWNLLPAVSAMFGLGILQPALILQKDNYVNYELGVLYKAMRHHL